MKKKSKFKIGDIITHKGDLAREYGSKWGVGEVIDLIYIDMNGSLSLKIRWSSGVAHWESPRLIQHAETPIQRMKRKYNEKEDGRSA